MKYLKLIIPLYTLAAIAALLKDNAYLRDRLDELTDKYWEGNRQIALYSDEVTKLRKKGKWLKDDDFFTVCSLCGAHILWKSEYCPCCGADMREEKQ